MNEDEVRRLAHEAAKREVREHLTTLGIDPDRPFEFQARMQFLQVMQAVWKTVVAQAITAIIGLVVVGICLAVWQQTTGAAQ